MDFNYLVHTKILLKYCRVQVHYSLSKCHAYKESYFVFNKLVHCTYSYFVFNKLVHCTYSYFQITVLILKVKMLFRFTLYYGHHVTSFQPIVGPTFSFFMQIDIGWLFGTNYDDDKRTHPMLKPYHLLDESVRFFNQ